MARWEPDAAGRLQHAAMALFGERGYAEVTVAEIADRAGLTKRTFFNHFTDKREVLFAGAASFQAETIAYVDEAADHLAPIDVAVAALTRSGQGLAQWGEFAQFRRALIASATELQERDLIKTATLSVAIAEALRRRNVPARTATFAAQAAVSIFSAAYDDWIDNRTFDFETLMQQSLGAFREAM